MKIVVIGAGVVGVTSAYFLAREGHEVELRDYAGAGGGASGVNAGLLVPGESLVWSTPEAPKLLVSALTGSQHGFKIKSSALPSLLTWGPRFLRECSANRSRANTAAAHALSVYSMTKLAEIVRAEGFEFDYERNGMVVLFPGTDDRGPTLGLEARRELVEQGEVYQVLDAAGLVELDAKYASATTHYGSAIFAPSAGHGDCGRFTRQLVGHLTSQLGVRVTLHGEPASLALSRGQARLTSTKTSEVDAIVVAAGARSRSLLKAVGVRLPIQPVRGFSVTVPILDPDAVPDVGGALDDLHVAFSRVGESLRISSTAQFGTLRDTVTSRDYEVIREATHRLFPRALDWSRVTYANDMRAVTPRGIPFIGATRIPNLFVNTGHGHLGWTQACGSSALLADVLVGRRAAIDSRPFALPGHRRLGRRRSREVVLASQATQIARDNGLPNWGVTR